MRRAALVVLALAAGLACARILGFKKAGPRPFEHRAHVLQGVSCPTCHVGVATSGDDSPLHLPDTKTCVSCHTQPHDARECGSCHGSPWTRNAAAEARVHLRFSHAEHVPELSGNCARCHVDVAAEGATLRPRMATCLACHEHAEEFQPENCAACHVDLAAEGIPPRSHLVHDGNFAREHGERAASNRDLCATCHSEKFCGGCHGATVPALPAMRAFDDPTAASVHRAGFRSRHAEEARAQPGLCATCHGQRACVACHDEEGIGAAAAQGVSPHPGTWVGVGTPNDHGPAARRDPLACASCHGGAGEALCVGCHRVGGVGGSPHPAGFSSQLSRGRDMPCRMCHLETP
jgi:hypothetical protein